MTGGHAYLPNTLAAFLRLTMNISRAFLLALLVSTPAAGQQDMAMPGMKMPMAKAPHKAVTPKRRRAALPAAKPSHTSMPGMDMPMGKKARTAPKRHRAFLRPAKPYPHASMPGMVMPQDHQKTHSQTASPVPPNSMPGMNMSPPGTGAKSAPPRAPSEKTMPGMDMSTPGSAKSASPPSSEKAMPGMDHRSMGHDMSGMGDMPGMGMKGVLGSYPMTRDASGTSWQPDLAEHHGIHAMAGDWSLMGHAMLWGIYDTQSGPRGADKTFAAGMLMGMARREFADGDSLSFRAMLSPDPFMGKSGYPLLLATGETANGTTPLVDRQHPHDLFMEMSGTYSHKLSDDDSVFLYAGYPGEPALGPPAFMHRASGMDIPQAPITHHWLDSTHVAFGVLTGGFVHDNWKLEVSRFTGREPDQYRYNFDQAKFDSTAVRTSYNPDEHWSLQGSWGYLQSPEQLSPTVNETATRHL